MRVLDELLLSNEEYGIELIGLKPYHFAYRMENSRFFLTQSEFYRDQNREAVATLETYPMSGPVTG